VKTIELTRGKVAIVDDEDFENLNRFEWSALRCRRKHKDIWYAIRTVELTPYKRGVKRHRRTVRMHRDILGISDSKILSDHKNGDGLDNQKANLRRATPLQNQFNKPKTPGCSSRYKGVTWRGGRKRWLAAIKHNGRSLHLGTFTNEMHAAAAYEKAAALFHGEFANTKAS
jgi:hypothetical protein